MRVDGVRPLGRGQLPPRAAVRGGALPRGELADQLGDRAGLPQGPAAGSYQLPKMRRKIHWVQR